MSFFEILHNLIFDYTLRTVALGTAVLGITSGMLGAFAVLRRQSLLGDAISHASLPGVALAFLLTRSKTPLVLMVGAALAGWLATLWMMSIIRSTRIKQDSALALVLSVFFGLGLVLLTFTQRLPDARQAGLDSFLFGQAATLVVSDVQHMALIGAAALLLVALFWKEMKLLSFDKDFATTLGLPVSKLDVLLTGLLVIAIVIGLQAVGVVLMSTMLVAPASAARQWTDRLGVMLLLSGLFGGLAGVSGAVISSLASGLSTGPTIVLVASLLVMVSLLFAPNRGLFARWVRERRSRQAIHLDTLLSDLYHLAAQHDDPHRAHSANVIGLMSARPAQAQASLSALRARGLVEEHAGQWSLTEAGYRAAQAAAGGQTAGTGAQNEPLTN